MQRILNDLLDRDEEIRQVILFIKNTEQIEVDQPDFGVRVDIKASVLLMLYNEIESIITSVFTRIHEIALAGTIPYSNYSNPVKEIIQNYYFGIRGKKDEFIPASSYVEYIDVIFDRHMVDLPYSKMIQRIQLYSGNLDSKSINEILQMYGIGGVEGVTELRTIKEKRNQLAHGEYSFEEIGRTVTHQQLDIMRQKTCIYLDRVIDEVNKYLNNHEYLVPRIA